MAGSCLLTGDVYYGILRATVNLNVRRWLATEFRPRFLSGAILFLPHKILDIPLVLWHLPLRG